MLYEEIESRAELIRFFGKQASQSAEAQSEWIQRARDIAESCGRRLEGGFDETKTHYSENAANVENVFAELFGHLLANDCRNTLALCSIQLVSLESSSATIPSSSSRISESQAYLEQFPYADVDLSSLEWHKGNRDYRIAVGSFASVYRCVYQRIPCALKYYDHMEDWTDKDIRKIIREARIMTYAQHDFIVSFRGFHVSEGIIVSELANCSLRKFLQRKALIEQCGSGNERYPTQLKLRWLTGLSTGLHFLHAHGIIHRDIKSQNVMLMIHSNGEVVAKLSDFGLSTAAGLFSTLGANAHDMSAAEGSTGYMAPELVDFDEAPTYSFATDVYAFGVLANELLTEALPWNGISVRLMEKMIGRGERPTLHVPQTSTEQDVVTLVGHANGGCLATSSGVRPSARELKRALDSIECRKK